MASATFEDHPTDPEKVILRKKPHLDKGRDYEEGFIDGMQHQAQSSVDKAVNAMSRTWVGLTDEDKKEYVAQDFGGNRLDAMDWAEKRLKEKNT